MYGQHVDMLQQHEQIGDGPMWLQIGGVEATKKVKKKVKGQGDYSAHKSSIISR